MDSIHGVQNGSAVLSEYGGFVDELAMRSSKCSCGGPSTPANVIVDAVPSSRTNECIETGVCVSANRVRDRPVCQLDQVDCDSNGDCHYAFVSGSHASRRTGDILTWFCKHGICYAVFIIPHAEGRNEAFSFLYKYFVVPPKVIVYDFACALHDYCLNRQPEHFKDSVSG